LPEGQAFDFEPDTFCNALWLKEIKPAGQNQEQRNAKIIIAHLLRMRKGGGWFFLQ